MLDADEESKAKAWLLEPRDGFVVHHFLDGGLRRLRCGLLVRVGTMAGERVTARKRKAGGKVVIKKRLKKFARHQSDQFMRVPVRQPPAFCTAGEGSAGRAQPKRACCEGGAAAGAGRGGAAAQP